MRHTFIADSPLSQWISNKFCTLSVSTCAGVGVLTGVGTGAGLGEGEEAAAASSSMIWVSVGDMACCGVLFLGESKSSLLTRGISGLATASYKTCFDSPLDLPFEIGPRRDVQMTKKMATAQAMRFLISTADGVGWDEMGIGHFGSEIIMRI